MFSLEIVLSNSLCGNIYQGNNNKQGSQETNERLVGRAFSYYTAVIHMT